MSVGEGFRGHELTVLERFKKDTEVYGGEKTNGPLPQE